MTMGEKVFIKNQYGKEVTRGSGVVATRMWPGMVKLPKDRTPEHPEEPNGTRIMSRRTVIKQILCDGITLSMDAAQFQALLMVFGAGLKGSVTGTEVTPGQGDYQSDFTPSWTAANSPHAISLETGDNVQAYEVDYTMIKSIKISWKSGDDSFVKVECEAFGKEIVATTFTNSLLPENGEFMLGNLVKVYIDQCWELLGTTQKTNLVREGSIEIQTGNHPKFMSDGAKTFSTHGEGSPEMLITLTMEGNTDADTLWDGFQAGSEYAIRVLFEGAQIGTTGTKHALQVDAFGAFDEIIPLGGEDNGNNLSTAIFTATGDRGQVAQVETATGLGTVSNPGNAVVIVTAAGMTGSPKTFNPPVTNGTPTHWMPEILAVLAADAALTALYQVTAGATADKIKLTRKAPGAANDATLNINIATGTATGITAAPTSADTTAGQLTSATEHKFGVKVTTDRATM